LKIDLIIKYNKNVVVIILLRIDGIFITKNDTIMKIIKFKNKCLLIF
jgi:hypothetical protein